jgi:CRISPR/Cas system-associated exonuclease Cas4 (RecB family)
MSTTVAAEATHKLPEPRVFVSEINDLIFCELKIALHSTLGDIRTEARERGREVHSAVENAVVTTTHTRVVDREEAARLRDAGETVVMPDVPILSKRLNVQWRADFVIWRDDLNVFELKTGTVPREPNRRLGTRAFESDAAQSLVYGILVEEEFAITPLTWIIYANQNFVDKIKAEADSAAAMPGKIIKALFEAGSMEVPFTPANRRYAEGAIARLRSIKQRPEIARRNHERPARCASCVYNRSQCRQSLHL